MKVEEPDAAAVVVDAGQIMSSGDSIMMIRAIMIEWHLQFRWNVEFH